MQIFSNGQMSYADPNVAQPDLDENGMPIAVSDMTHNTVVCTITTASENRKGNYEDGKYHNCQYSVTCNLEDVGNEFNSVRTVSLTHDIKGFLGEFTVQRIEFYTITQTVEIWV